MRIRHGAPVIVVSLDEDLVFDGRAQCSFNDLLVNLTGAGRDIARLVQAGCRVVVTYEPVPRSTLECACESAELASSPRAPFDAIQARGQGLIGYLLAQSIRNHLRRLKIKTHVCAMTVQVQVQTADAGCAVCSEQSASIPSVVREPVNVVEGPIVRNLVAGGTVVVCGSSAVAVRMDADGYLSGIETAVDPDSTAARLATQVRAKALLMLDAIDPTRLVDTPPRRSGELMTSAEATTRLAQGRFSPDIKRSKLVAALRFAQGDKVSILAPLANAWEAMAGGAGICIVGTESSVLSSSGSPAMPLPLTAFAV